MEVTHLTRVADYAPVRKRGEPVHYSKFFSMHQRCVAGRVRQCVFPQLRLRLCCNEGCWGGRRCAHLCGGGLGRLLKFFLTAAWEDAVASCCRGRSCLCGGAASGGGGG